jgi:hypothetical protein
VAPVRLPDENDNHDAGSACPDALEIHTLADSGYETVYEASMEDGHACQDMLILCVAGRAVVRLFLSPTTFRRHHVS